MWDTMSKETADSMFANKVSQYQNWKNFVTTPLTPAQEAALTSFEYNLWPGIWQKNAMPIIDNINKGNLSAAWSYISQYTNAGGKYVQGLANRRNQEIKLLYS